MQNQVKNGSVWVHLDGVTKGFVTVTRRQGSALYYKHTDDNGYIGPNVYVTPEEAFLELFREV
jgi:hypothetical protein